MHFDILKGSLVLDWQNSSKGGELIKNSRVKGQFGHRLRVTKLKHLLSKVEKYYLSNQKSHEIREDKLKKLFMEILQPLLLDY